MKILLIVLLGIILIFNACRAKGGDKIDKELFSKSVIIDVRTRAEYAEGHLTNAILIPYDVIGEEINKHINDKNKSIIVYCRSGRRSGIAKNVLDKLGYKNVTNGGGYSNMKKFDK